MITTTETPRGTLAHDGRTYLVYTITNPEAWTSTASKALCVLESERGARYLVADYGPNSRLSTWNLGTPVSRRSSANRFVMSTPFDKKPLRRSDVFQALGND